DFVDDGFGGKNSHIVIADLLGGDEGDSGAAKAKINFVSWTMIGVQGNYITRTPSDYLVDEENSEKIGDTEFTIKSKSGIEKGLDLESVTIGMKSYNKFVGNFLPNCPLYIEIALAETEMEDYAGNKTESLNYLFRQDRYGNDIVSVEDGIKNLISGIVGNPVSYLAKTTNNNSDKSAGEVQGTAFGAIPGPGSNPFLGHLKFGFNTPYVNYLTGFNYAKPSLRNAITWTTVSGTCWDAGYQHIGGFNQFSLGEKAVAFLEEKTGLTFDIGFAPNKTADRKGSKYGYWGWAGFKKDNLVVDFQTNGMYNGDWIFYKPVEHDFILGAKDEFEFDAGKLSVSAEGLIATHQRSSKELVEEGASNTTDYFGYSTDVFYRSGDFDGIKNMAGNISVGFKGEKYEVKGEYRFRGSQASMLYVRENHDDATFDLSSQLGVLNEQRVSLDASVAPIEGLSIGLSTKAKMALQKLHTTRRVYNTDGTYELIEDNAEAYAYSNSATEGRQSWYDGRFDDNRALYDIDGGALWTFKPTVSYDFADLGLKIGAYTSMNYRDYDFADDVGKYLVSSNDYASSESKFRLSKIGVTASKKFDSDIVKNVDFYYGMDNTNGARLFNSLIGQVKFAKNITATLAFGLKTINDNDAAIAAGYKDKIEYKCENGNLKGITITQGNSSLNNPFAFAVGIAKQFDKFKKPTVYAQFVYNTDPFKHFGDGQEQLNLDGANINGSVEKEKSGNIDAVDWYDGRAAVRVGIRWDI
ncbi:MAG: hypothetical protein SO238_08510, partial [Treponema sp.]|nr:hypothetical protein [Spirochaetia bacterium]MDY4768452.1 hypothetical protein [Treponema sp.]